jgi:hypothetical protein
VVALRAWRQPAVAPRAWRRALARVWRALPPAASSSDRAAAGLARSRLSRPAPPSPDGRAATSPEPRFRRAEWPSLSWRYPRFAPRLGSRHSAIPTTVGWPDGKFAEAVQRPEGGTAAVRRWLFGCGSDWAALEGGAEAFGKARAAARAAYRGLIICTCRTQPRRGGSSGGRPDRPCRRAWCWRRPAWSCHSP